MLTSSFSRWAWTSESLMRTYFLSTQGLWTKHVQYYLDMANDPARTAKYSPFLGSQDSAVFHFGTDASDDVGSVWYVL